MSWEIILVPEVHDWYLALDEASASLVRDSIELLAERGPALGRPAVDRITGSRLHNLKELRPGSAGKTEIRILFIFDPKRQAVLLVAGDKGRQLDPLVPRCHQAGRGPLRPLSHHPARGDPMTTHYRWETTLDERRRADPGIDDPARRAAAREIRTARDIGYRLSQMRKQRGLTQAAVARAMGVSQARVSRMEHGDIDRMQVESIAAYVAAIGGHLRLVADFDQASTTFIDYTDALTA